MLTFGTYKGQGIDGQLAVEWGLNGSEVCLIIGGNIVSAYKQTRDNKQFCYGSTKAKEIHGVLSTGWRGCNARNGVPAPFAKGTVSRHTFATRTKVQYRVDKYNSSELAGAEVIDPKGIQIYLEYQVTDWRIPENIPYIALTVEQEFADSADPADAIQVRSLAEISLEKDVTWLNGRNYYIVNDFEQAEQLFKVLENYNGIISYDTETTGLKINMFGKVNSKWAKQLADYNAEHTDSPIRADKLVGIILCCEPGTSYYIPCANRKFANLYSDMSDPRVQNLANKFKAYYTVGEGRSKAGDIPDYFRSTAIEDMTADVLVMERVRKILETRKLTGHHISFDWKVSWLYEINANFTDDTMIMHQLMYKFRSTTSNRGEPSDLKSLTKREFGIDQLSLTDFFVGGAEDERAETRRTAGKKKSSKKNKKVYIDFSYMDYNGARAYGPADGDFSLALFLKYKRDMRENHRDLEYLYTVETIVAKAIGYMEFYGHRIDEDKIEETRKKYEQEKADLGKQMMELAGLPTDQEFNMGSPAQMAWLFYEHMGIPADGGVKSVKKASLKPLMALKNEDGSLKYPIIKLYSDWKKVDTLLTKFFDNLQNFMYPGGYIFSSFGQISTATGRMSCKTPNCQQYPKAVTKIVVPRDNFIMVDADYSQIEYRTLTALAKETNLMKTFEDPDSDYHTLMASRMFGVPYASVTPAMRSDAKAFNFGIPYGMGFRSLAIRLTGMAGDAQVEEAKEKYELYFKDQPRVRKFFQDVKEAALINKYTQTFFGRRRYYSFVGKDGKEDNRRKGAALRQAGNACIQGCLGGEVRIQTRQFGIVPIKEVAGTVQEVWDGHKWTRGDVTYSGKKQKCIVTFSNGHRMICSPIHKFLVRDSKGTEKFVECKDLKQRICCDSPDYVVINPEFRDSGIDDFYVNSEWDSLLGYGGPSVYGTYHVRGDRTVNTKKMRELLGKLLQEQFDVTGTIENYGLSWSLRDNKANRELLQDLLVLLQFLGIRSVLYHDGYSCTLEIYHGDLAKVNALEQDEYRGGYRGKQSGETTEQEKVDQSAGIFQGTVEVVSVDITDEFIEMYDVCNTERGYYVADGLVTHNTAADIYKISVARMFTWIQQENLLGQVLITNMIHDEQLLEVNCDTMNIQAVLSNVLQKMQFSVEGFPPLYVGGGVGVSWASAKDKMAEIHPVLGQTLIEEMEGQSLYVDKPVPKEEWLRYFNKRIYDFEKDKVIKYLTDPSNYGQDLHPAIGGILNLRFVPKSVKDKLAEDPGYYKGHEDDQTRDILAWFIEENGLDVDPKVFSTKYNSGTAVVEDEEDKEYDDDDEDEDSEDDEDYFRDGDFALIDEDDKLFGVDINDLIKMFGLVVSKEQGICGVDISVIPTYKREELYDYLTEHACEPDDEGAMRVEFLQPTNVLSKTDVWVKGIDGSAMSAKLALNTVINR